MPGIFEQINEWVSGRNKHKWIPPGHKHKVVTENTLFAGNTGTGKSYKFKHDLLPLIADKSKEYRQVIILDMKSEYKKHPVDFVVNINDIADYTILHKIMNGYYTEKAPKILSINSEDYQVHQIDEIIFQYLNIYRNKIIVFEEAGFFFEDTKKQWPKEMKKFIRTKTLAHNFDSNIVCITQFPNDFSKNFLGAFDRGFIFSLKRAQVKYLYDAGYLDDKNFDWGKKEEHKFCEVIM